MVFGVRSLLAVAVPTVVAILGLLWFRKKKNNPSVEYKKPPDRQPEKAVLDAAKEPVASRGLEGPPKSTNDKRTAPVKEAPGKPVVSEAKDDKLVSPSAADEEAVTVVEEVCVVAAAAAPSMSAPPPSYRSGVQSEPAEEQPFQVSAPVSVEERVEALLLQAEAAEAAANPARGSDVSKPEESDGEEPHGGGDAEEDGCAEENPAEEDEPEHPCDCNANQSYAGSLDPAVGGPKPCGKAVGVSDAKVSRNTATQAAADRGDVTSGDAETGPSDTTEGSTLKTAAGPVEEDSSVAVSEDKPSSSGPRISGSAGATGAVEADWTRDVATAEESQTLPSREQPEAIPRETNCESETPIPRNTKDPESRTQNPISKCDTAGSLESEALSACPPCEHNGTSSDRSGEDTPDCSPGTPRPLASRTPEEEVEEVTSMKRSNGRMEVEEVPASVSPSSIASSGSPHSETNCDAHSEISTGSADSGRGGSIAAELASHVVTDMIPTTPGRVLFEFDFPSEYCGRLIGRSGRNILDIKERAGGVEITVNRKLYTLDHQVVVIEGTQKQVDKALSIIKKRFPVSQFPGISFEPSVSENAVLSPDMMQLSLPVGVPVDTLVSSVVTPNHVFLQQPTHPTFPMLERLTTLMLNCYCQEGVPELPRPIEVGVICAAPMYNGWYRARVMTAYPEIDECDIKFVDFGGYLRIAGSLLRQIRSDFTTLPFQAVECYMANVVPPKDMDVFPLEANEVMEKLVQGKLLQAEIVGHEETDGVPYIQLCEMLPNQTTFVNQELVNRGVAQWFEQLL